MKSFLFTWLPFLYCCRTRVRGGGTTWTYKLQKILSSPLCQNWHLFWMENVSMCLSRVPELPNCPKKNWHKDYTRVAAQLPPASTEGTTPLKVSGGRAATPLSTPCGHAQGHPLWTIGVAAWLPFRPPPLLWGLLHGHPAVNPMWPCSMATLRATPCEQLGWPHDYLF